ncbi:methyl-accepting chemotaxis protein [Jatrophihabitans telluris]|uniref:Methyl-accepting chemotaxis protein n=1 Tax=Jatrophihabitans telluris TaxID=2038343 RepID=A0ABY4QW30_9ACTN|nr:methyl-accepting chemotaxis protein [Jatrophihabitans telluris]UQX87337.1 methyl-accepting chemotaxis protein [Jatrophihabitans telluris]
MAIVTSLFAVVIVAAVSVWGVGRLSSATFDDLETRQVAQDAQGVRLALDYEIKLLANYGSTNAIWDGSYSDVKNGDRQTFAADFAPSSLPASYGVDAVLGLGLDGTVRVGGLAGGPAYTPLPSELATPAVLKGLWNPQAKSGKSTCGVLAAQAFPYLYCGFGAYPSSGTGNPAGGLVFLSALNPAKLSRLSQQLSLGLSVAASAPGEVAQRSSLNSSIGTLAVAVSFTSGSRTAMDITIPAGSGQSVTLQAGLARPIHSAAGHLSHQLLGYALVAAVLAVAAAVAFAGRAVRRKIRPLRETTEQIMASGDHRLRIDSKARGDIGALAGAIDSMLDALSDRELALQREHQQREQELQDSAEQQQRAEAAVRGKAQQRLVQTAESVLTELDEVLAQAGHVSASAGIIDSRVEHTEAVTESFVTQANRAGQVVGELTESLRHVRGVSELIASVAAQTNLLALNATIEAARAGSAGDGFRVVASEVKELATTTARSTTQIAETISRLEAQAEAMSGVIAEMGGGISDIERASAEVSEVTAQQRASAEQLGSAVQDAIGRISTLTRTEL